MTYVIKELINCIMCPKGAIQYYFHFNRSSWLGWEKWLSYLFKIKYVKYNLICYLKQLMKNRFFGHIFEI